MRIKKSFKVSDSGLIADKELFRVWYEYYRLALVSKSKNIKDAIRSSKSYYAEWGTDTELHFDDWWITHQHLFTDTDSVRLLNKDEIQDEYHLYVSVPRTRSINVAVDEFRALLTEEFNTRTKRTHVPIHRFAPTEVQGYKRESARLYLSILNIYLDNPSLKGKKFYDQVINYFLNKRYKRKQNSIPDAFEGLDVGDDTAQRNVRRYRTKGKKILLNVANGVFPGKF
jgi:hypothetical protein